MKSRTPTRLRYGERRTNREATDTGTGPVRRGSGHGMPAKGDRGADWEAPAGAVRNSAVLGKEGGLGGESDRAMVARKPGNSGGAKGPDLRHASEAEEDQAIDMSLTTPEKIRNLQKKLYLKAKQERRRKVSSRGTRQFSDQVVYGKLGVVRLRWKHLGPPPATA